MLTLLVQLSILGLYQLPLNPCLPPHLMIQQVTYNQSLQCQLAQALTRQHWHLKMYWQSHCLVVIAFRLRVVFVIHIQQQRGLFNCRF